MRHAETKDHEVPDLRLSGFRHSEALVRKLYREEKYALSLLIGCGIFFGLRISDLLSLTWEQLLNEDDKFVIYEKKTNKRRTIKISAQFKPHIQACYEAIHPNFSTTPTPASLESTSASKRKRC